METYFSNSFLFGFSRQLCVCGIPFIVVFIVADEELEGGAGAGKAMETSGCPSQPQDHSRVHRETDDLDRMLAFSDPLGKAT